MDRISQKICCMFDRIRIEALLDRIEEAILLIQSKRDLIAKPDDFLLNSDGMFLLSGICMQLILSPMNITVLMKKKFLM